VISGLISWLVVVLIVSVLYWVISLFAPAQITRVVLVVCVVIIVLALIFVILPFASVHLGR
jgi:hypothetical protein